MRTKDYTVSYGVVLSREIYIRFGSKLRNGIVFNTKDNDENTNERLWFGIGKRTTYMVCNDTGTILLKRFIQCGLLIDLTKITDITSVDSLHSRIMSVLRSKEEYIRNCNLIRNKIASEIQGRLRWNGVEWESLTNDLLIRRVSIFSGLFKEGVYWNIEGAIQFKAPHYDNNGYINEHFREALDLDIGQSKLYSLMFGFTMTRNIIYIGSAPGEGWMSYLRKAECNIKIYSFDPNNLFFEQSDYANWEAGENFEIIHLKMFVNNSQDIWTSIPMGQYDFIWDVRGNTNEIYQAALDRGNPKPMDEVEKEINGEIKILNEIMSSAGWSQIVRANIKIHINMIDKYLLPHETRFFPLPFQKREDNIIINELRAVFKNRKASHYCNHEKLDSNRIKAQLEIIYNTPYVTGTVDQVLFVNSLLMRYDEQNFLYDLDDNFVDTDVNLFCLNLNKMNDITHYLDTIAQYERKHLSSFFTDTHLEMNEHMIDEIELLHRNEYVFDSRLLIPRKLANLYFFTNYGNPRWYKNELSCSETYLIMNEEMELREREQIIQYDEIRDIICKEEGGQFYKFPNAYTLDEEIISPSGHAARMVSMHIKGRCSINMLIRKILYSFLRLKASWVRLKPNDSIRDDSLFGIKLNIVIGSGEHNERKLWHTRQEWITGIEAGYRLHNGNTPERLKLLLLTRITDDQKKNGIEVHNLFNRIGFDKNKYRNLLASTMRNAPLSSEAQREQLYERLHRKESTDVVKYYVENYHHDQNWVSMIHYFKIDKLIRKLLIHKSFFLNISSGMFPEHDAYLMRQDSLLSIAMYEYTDEARYLLDIPDLKPYRFQATLHIIEKIGLTLLQTDEYIFMRLADLWIEMEPFHREINGKTLKALFTSPSSDIYNKCKYVDRMHELLHDEIRFSVTKAVTLLRTFSECVH